MIELEEVFLQLFSTWFVSESDLKGFLVDVLNQVPGHVSSPASDASFLRIVNHLQDNCRRSG